MEIRAKVNLSLPNTFYKVTLKYDTFEKATYDSYLIASLVANSKNEREALDYIDEITGKGSLNPHFRKLYEQIKEFSDDQIRGILENSLFPVTVIDTKNHFKFYPMFNATRMNDNVYPGNLRDNEELLKKLIMPKGEYVKFLSMDYQEEDGTVKLDNYNAVFSDNQILVDLDNNQYYPIAKEDFNLVHTNDVEDLDGYLGAVGSKITEGNWNVLSKSIVGTFSKANFRFKDSNGNHCVLYGDCIKTIEIINVFGLYFYKDTRYEFSSKNLQICKDAIKYLIESKNINEFKTKSLIWILSVVDDLSAREVVQYILSRKDSKEISELGLRIIKNGLEKGWSHEVLLAIKKQVPSSEYKYLYRLDSKLDFNVEDLLGIDDVDLTASDKKKKQAYISKKENMLKEINQMIGEITNSGVREKIKQLPKSKLKDSVKKFVDKRQGHNTKDYESMTVEKLEKEYNDIKEMYFGDYREILKELKKINN